MPKAYGFTKKAKLEQIIRELPIGTVLDINGLAKQSRASIASVRAAFIEWALNKYLVKKVDTRTWIRGNLYPLEKQDAK